MEGSEANMGVPGVQGQAMNIYATISRFHHSRELQFLHVSHFAEEKLGPKPYTVIVTDGVSQNVLSEQLFTAVMTLLGEGRRGPCQLQLPHACSSFTS